TQTHLRLGIVHHADERLDRLPAEHPSERPGHLPPAPPAQPAHPPLPPSPPRAAAPPPHRLAHGPELLEHRGDPVPSVVPRGVRGLEKDLLDDAAIATRPRLRQPVQQRALGRGLEMIENQRLETPSSPAVER